MATTGGHSVNRASGRTLDSPVRHAGTPGAPAGVDHLWSAEEVSSFLGVPVATLHQWRYRGLGPDAYRVGRHLRYDPAAVHRWLDESCRSTG